MLWSEAQIIECKIDEQKIKVHFIGWHARWDIWTDAMNVAAHGTYVRKCHYVSSSFVGACDDRN